MVVMQLAFALLTLVGGIVALRFRSALSRTPGGVLLGFSLTNWFLILVYTLGMTNNVGVKLILYGTGWGVGVVSCVLTLAMLVDDRNAAAALIVALAGSLTMTDLLVTAPQVGGAKGVLFILAAFGSLAMAIFGIVRQRRAVIQIAPPQPELPEGVYASRHSRRVA